MSPLAASIELLPMMTVRKEKAREDRIDGPLEATNNKIGTLQRKAYGYRDREYFILQIYSSHLKKYALVG